MPTTTLAFSSVLLSPLRFVDDVLIHHAAQFLQRVSPLLPGGSPAEAEYWGFWFLSPRQHVYEFVGLNAVFLAALPFIVSATRSRLRTAASIADNARRRASVTGESLLSSVHLLHASLERSARGLVEEASARVQHAREVVNARVEEAKDAVHANVEASKDALNARMSEASALAMELAPPVGSDRESDSEDDEDKGGITTTPAPTPAEYSSGSQLNLGSSAAAVPDHTYHPHTPRLSWLPRAGIPLFLLSTSWLITFQQKYAEGALMFMLQPCHVSCVLLAVLLATPRKMRGRDLLFNLYFPIQWGAVLALVQPDLRTHTTVLHVGNFILEHVLILYRVLPKQTRWAVCSLSFVCMGLYHSALLATLGVFMGMLGRGYRLAMFASAALLTVGMRFGVFELGMAVANRCGLGWWRRWRSGGGGTKTIKVE
ncbi:hypothetical protein BCR44DRAFT_1430642 [Catenaria anguillulae PL171]|uniref:Transmembrane protein n=1 Tax=Catenaria anguillulae PL171 TaxID=765915 RepID=A0A1Y2HRG0_9FUNG|nr:hypothetical protein BCR44DRAFT_1430642 [Catenaria anguillulae PL171]